MPPDRARWLLIKTSTPRLKLTPWERGFLARIEDIINRRGVGALTDDQVAKLEEIGAK